MKIKFYKTLGRAQKVFNSLSTPTALEGAYLLVEILDGSRQGQYVIATERDIQYLSIKHKEIDFKF